MRKSIGRVGLIGTALGVCILGAAFGVRYWRSSARAKPEVSFNKSISDASEVVLGSDAVFEFRCRNDGRRMVRIESIRRSCGCIVADGATTGDCIAPGAERSIRAAIDTHRIAVPGPVAKSLDVTFADAERESEVQAFTLELRATIVPPFMVSPEQVDFDESAADRPFQLTLRSPCLPLDELRKAQLRGPEYYKVSEPTVRGNEVTLSVSLTRPDHLSELTPLVVSHTAPVPYQVVVPVRWLNKGPEFVPRVYFQKLWPHATINAHFWAQLSQTVWRGAGV